MASPDIREKLREQVGRLQSAPFLFVGSGLSRRYIELETWESLLRRFSKGLPHSFDYYRASADSDLSRVSSLLAIDFHEYWWNSPEFKDSRAQYAEKVSGRSSSLKYEISRYVADQKYVLGRSHSIDREVALLKKCVVDGVVTTNWDTFLESAFPDFKVFVGQGAVLAAHPQGISEIYKIHGCSSQPDSVILTEEDYKEFDRKNPYLAAKLLTMFVEHTVIFLDYSLSDRNIQSIIGQVASCLSPAETEILRNRLIFVQWDSEGEGDSYQSTVMQVGGENIPVTIIRAADFSAVYEALADGKRKFPARLLRGMKEQLYELIKTNDPSGKMFVLDIEDAEHFSDLEVVYGVGLSEKIGAVGYAAIQIEDLLKDLMDDNSEYSADKVVQTRLPELLKRTKYVPIFKYLSRAGLLGADGLAVPSVDSRIANAVKTGFERFLPPAQYKKKKTNIQSTYAGVSDLAGKCDPEHAICYLPLLGPKKLDADELKGFIVANFHLMNSPRQNVKTYFRSVMCLYDWLKYGRVAGPAPGSIGGLKKR